MFGEIKAREPLARGGEMGYVLRLGKLKPFIEDLIVLGLNVVVSATDGEVVFCVYLPNVAEDLRKL